MYIKIYIELSSQKLIHNFTRVVISSCCGLQQRWNEKRKKKEKKIHNKLWQQAPPINVIWRKFFFFVKIKGNFCQSCKLKLNKVSFYANIKWTSDINFREMKVNFFFFYFRCDFCGVCLDEEIFIINFFFFLYFSFWFADCTFKEYWILNPTLWKHFWNLWQNLLKWIFFFVCSFLEKGFV